MQLVPWGSFGELSYFRGEKDRLRDRLFGERPFVSDFTE